MTVDLGRDLLHTGRSHAAAACLLYRATREYAAEEGIEDTIAYAFNGPNSLSIQYLLGLGLELMLKSAIAALDAGVDAKFLKDEVRHDLEKALDEAEKRGFVSKAQTCVIWCRCCAILMRSIGSATSAQSNFSCPAISIRSWNC